MLHDHPSDGLTAIRTHIAAIFVSLELSRSNWLVTSLSPGQGEKMSKHSVAAGNVAGLLTLFADPQMQGRGPDRPGLSDHHDPGGGAGRVLAAPRSATARRREPRRGSRFDRSAAKAQAGQDGQDRRRDAAANASCLQARRAAGLRDGGCALARGRGSPAALPRTADIDRGTRQAREPDQGSSVRTGRLRLRPAAARPANAA